jgi:abequosyltransferase
MMNVKLSICIPTYNRAAFLEEAVMSILSQSQDGIEIVISDNCSQDETSEVVSKLRQKHSHIKYFRWDENMGADLNYLKAVELATGEYCWLLGSDDALIQGAISRVLAEIKNGHDIYLCNRIDCSFSMQPIIKFNWLNKTADQLFDFSRREDVFDYFKSACSLGAVFSYLSTIVVKKTSWNSVQYESSMTGTAYSHAYILLVLVAEGTKLKYLRDALVLNRMGNDSFLENGHFQRFMLDVNGYLKIATKVFVNEDVKSAFLKIMTREHPWHNLAKIKYFDKDKWYLARVPISQFGYSKYSLASAELIGSMPYVVGLMKMSKYMYKSARLRLK